MYSHDIYLHISKVVVFFFACIAAVVLPRVS